MFLTQFDESTKESYMSPLKQSLSGGRWGCKSYSWELHDGEYEWALYSTETYIHPLHEVCVCRRECYRPHFTPDVFTLCDLRVIIALIVSTYVESWYKNTFICDAIGSRPKAEPLRPTSVLSATIFSISQSKITCFLHALQYSFVPFVRACLKHVEQKLTYFLLTKQQSVTLSFPLVTKVKCSGGSDIWNDRSPVWRAVITDTHAGKHFTQKTGTNDITVISQWRRKHDNTAGLQHRSGNQIKIVLKATGLPDQFNLST